MWLFFIAVIACGATDFFKHIIPNYITLPLLAAGLLFNLSAGNFNAGLRGFLACFLLGFVLFALGGLGGGDVKLMAAVGTWVGIYDAFYIIFIALCFGVLWGFIKMARQGILLGRILYLVRGAALFFAGCRGCLAVDKIPEKAGEKIPANVIPFGTCLAVAVVVFIITQPIIFKIMLTWLYFNRQV
ncbi:A24 family peptidase [Moorella naiadis]|uniref:prepilin peptidase n=1 Tax=Moorella naiadis (nom. illeg.) TaxID=3093670 RepID=UPI003D9CBAFE